jgi:hypothetical protein
VSGQVHAPTALPPGKSPRLGGPQSRSGRYGEVNIFTLPGFELSPPLVVQPVASRYTDWAMVVEFIEYLQIIITRNYSAVAN